MSKQYRPAVIARKDGKTPIRKGGEPRTSHHRRRRSGRRPPNRAIPVIIFGALIVVVMQVLWVNRNKDKFENPLVRQLFRQLYNARQLPIECYHCGGTGLTEGPDGTSSFCPVCFGVGRNYIKVIDEDDVLCATCRGMGRVYDPEKDHAHLCPACSGRGLVRGRDTEGTGGEPVRLLQIECDLCEGGGMIRDPRINQAVNCPLCYGLGYRWARKMKDSEAICPACGGMGQLFDRNTRTVQPCERCDGRGIIAGAPTKANAPAEPTE